MLGFPMIGARHLKFERFSRRDHGVQVHVEMVVLERDNMAAWICSGRRSEEWNSVSLPGLVFDG